MGFKLSVQGGPGSIELGDEVVTSIKNITDTPDDSNARSNDVSLGIEVKGRIIAGIDGGETSIKLAQWSIIPVEQANCYGQVTVEYVHAGMVVRSISIPNAFIVSYKEEYDNDNGVGYFTAVIRQKRDKNAAYTCTGNY